MYFLEQRQHKASVKGSFINNMFTQKCITWKKGELWCISMIHLDCVLRNKLGMGEKGGALQCCIICKLKPLRSKMKLFLFRRCFWFLSFIIMTEVAHLERILPAWRNREGKGNRAPRVRCIQGGQADACSCECVKHSLLSYCYLLTIVLLSIRQLYAPFAPPCMNHELGWMAAVGTSPGELLISGQRRVDRWK